MFTPFSRTRQRVRTGRVSFHDQRYSLADTSRVSIRESGFSYSRLAQLAKLNSGMISHFITGTRDMTLGVASRLCAVLGYGLTKVGEAVTEPLEAPPKTNRDPKRRRPASAVQRGRGRRVDLEAKEKPAPSGPVQARERGAGKVETAPATGGSVAPGSETARNPKSGSKA